MPKFIVPIYKLIASIAPHRVSTNGILTEPLRRHASPLVEKWASAYMFKIFLKKPLRINEQFETYLKEKSVHFSFAAKKDREYLEVFLQVAKAKSVSLISDDDLKSFTEKLRELYNYELYVEHGFTALRNASRNVRKRGFPVMQPSRIRPR